VQIHLWLREKGTWLSSRDGIADICQKGGMRN
jgi:hypothetical protein